LRFSANVGIHTLDMALGVIRYRVQMKHRCELRFRSHRAFTHALLSRVPYALAGLFLFYMAVLVPFLLLQFRSKRVVNVL